LDAENAAEQARILAEEETARLSAQAAEAEKKRLEQEEEKT
jgi:hypothetical protein